MIGYVTITHPNGTTERVWQDSDQDTAIEKTLVKIKDVLQALPLGTLRRLRGVRDSADYSNPAPATNGDTADLLLSILESGDPINVKSAEFDTLMAWAMSQNIVRQSDVDQLKSLI